jgi:GNAT superfamily N-acetyltransferase
MSEAAMVPSIASIRDEVGARAARHLDTAFRAIMRPPAAEHRADFMRVITGELHPLGNAAIVSNPNDPAVTQAAATPLQESGLPAAVLFTEGVSTDAAQALEAMGFAHHGAMPAMAVDIDAMGDTALPAGYTWARVGAGSEGSAWADALATGYEIPVGLARLFSPVALGADMAADAAIQFFAVLKDGEPVATSLFFLADGLAGIYSVSTLAAERGRGLGAHATAQALREARQLGCRVGVLQSSPAGHSVYLKLGFQDLGEVPMFVRIPQ